MEIMAVCPSIFVSKIMQSNKENVDRDLSIVTTRTLGPQTRAKFLHSLSLLPSWILLEIREEERRGRLTAKPFYKNFLDPLFDIFDFSDRF